ncbi:MAG: hypothetical protein M3Y69_11885 [Verrucomicrobiota bacterium]|nr:hypothetical protein [Verrucomicrobiota bacterium]
MSDGDGKPQPDAPDPAKLAQLLEIELMQKRATWQQARARRRNIRALSFLFLFVVIGAALVIFFVFFSSDRVTELRANTAHSASPSPAPSPR